MEALDIFPCSMIKLFLLPALSQVETHMHTNRKEASNRTRNSKKQQHRYFNKLSLAKYRISKRLSTIRKISPGEDLHPASMQIIVIEIIFVKGFQPTLFKTQILSQITYINSWDISRFIFRELRMTFFHKIMVAEKYFSNA